MTQSRCASFRVLFAASVLTLCGTVTALAEEAHLALRGHDPVAYFTDARPVKGSPEISADFDDATYQFASDEHRSMFLADPDRYAPQYAGYCAGGISAGKKIEGDPQAWVISDGKLFVFWDKSEIPEFKAKAAQMTRQADARWQTEFKGR